VTPEQRNSFKHSFKRFYKILGALIIRIWNNLDVARYNLAPTLADNFFLASLTARRRLTAERGPTSEKARLGLLAVPESGTAGSAGEEGSGEGGCGGAQAAVTTAA
jgi:hypothetical protein